MSTHCCQDLIDLFNELFMQTEQTQLVAGGVEPIYLPSDAEHSLHRIIFTQDYYSSALHEIAHWCIAGKQRRMQVDYGYWYSPDGRNAEQQRLFQSMEVRPQAIEWIFSLAAGIKFHTSQDNLSMISDDDADFSQQIYHQVCIYLDKGLPARAETFNQRLLTFYQRTAVFNSLYENVKILHSKANTADP